MHRKSYGFDIFVLALPLRTKFSIAYLCDNIIPKILGGMPFALANSPRQLVFHMDNATSHRTWESITGLKKFRIRPVDHSPHSPNLALSDFDLFGKLKDALAR
jgi:hypothetical protein